MKKGITICRIVAVASLFMVFAVTAVTLKAEHWSQGMSAVFRTVNWAAWGAFVLSVAVATGLDQKIKDKKKDERIEELEREIRRLKREP